MTVVDSIAPSAKTQPLEWNWVEAYVALDASLAELEAKVFDWNWERDLKTLHRRVDDLARRMAV